MQLSFLILGVLAVPAVAAVAAHASPVPWNFKAEFLPYLVKQVPDLLKSQDKKTGRFGTGVWIVHDQHALFPLAAAWAIEHPDNPYYHSAEVLQAIMAGGDALIDAQDADGKWVFRKKDNSTWGDIYMPWTYSRWIRAYGLIKDAMPPERRARWEQALTLGFEGIAKSELKRVHNIPAHHALSLYHAGQVLNRPPWRQQASDFMKKVVAEQDEDGFWSENLGPVVGYNFVYTDALGTYHALSGDETVLPALERAARFHANFTYPDGSNVETVDERQVYKSSTMMPNVGFTFSPEGRGYVRGQWERNKAKRDALGADLAASFVLYGREGPAAPMPGQKARHRFVLGGNKAVVHRQGPWFVALSAYHAPGPTSRWIQDRQNLVSLFHDKTGLILGGGNTKLQPLWSTFTVGDTARLAHKPGDEKPDFLPPPGLHHVPTAAALDPDALSLALTYGSVRCRVRVDVSEAGRARLIYSIDKAPEAPVAAHLTLLPRLGKEWTTASGKAGILGDGFRLAPGAAGAWLAHNGWRVTLPPGASVSWPVLPHNPYVKDGHAAPAEGRIVVSLPFGPDLLTQEVTVEAP